MVSVFSLSLLIQGCEADVDLNNIDTSVKVNANVATPIGSIRATLGDFFGDGTFGITIDSIKNHSVLTFRDTFSIEREFHKINLADYISSKTLNMNVYDRLKGLMHEGKIVGTGTQIPLTFPLTLKLSGINKDISKQRLDSALIKDARFVSKITPAGNLPIEWNWIDKVTISLGENFYRPSGNTVTVYQRGDDYTYGQEIPINVDEFSLNLMKNKHPQNWKEYANNVTDSCTFDITLYVTIPTSAGEIAIPTTAKFQYELGVQFIDYHAIWGMFEPSDDMSVTAEDRIGDFWEPWNSINKLCLPLAQPSVDVAITTQLAGALILEGDHLYTKNEQGDIRYATFGGKQTLYKYFNKNEYLPLNSEIGAETDIHVLFDNDPERGCLDKLFAIRPDYIGYKFAVKFNEQETPQIRMTNNTSIRLDAACELPMIFNEGLEIAYSDTINDIDLSALDIDSILNSVTVLDTLEEAKAKLVITLENSIPLEFIGKLTCLDANGNIIIDPKTNEPFILTEKDSIVIAAPKFTFENHAWSSTATESIEVINVDREDLETIKKINKVVFYIELNDKAMQQAYDQGLFNVKLTDDNYLRVKLGVGASVEAVLNFDSVINQ
jgi:hypothetical protein